MMAMEDIPRTAAAGPAVLHPHGPEGDSDARDKGPGTSAERATRALRFSMR